MVPRAGSAAGADVTEGSMGLMVHKWVSLPPTSCTQRGTAMQEVVAQVYNHHYCATITGAATKMTISQ